MSDLQIAGLLLAGLGIGFVLGVVVTLLVMFGRGR